MSTTKKSGRSPWPEIDQRYSFPLASHSEGQKALDGMFDSLPPGETRVVRVELARVPNLPYERIGVWLSGALVGDFGFEKAEAFLAAFGEQIRNGGKMVRGAVVAKRKRPDPYKTYAIWIDLQELGDKALAQRKQAVLDQKIAEARGRQDLGELGSLYFQKALQLFESGAEFLSPAQESRRCQAQASAHNGRVQILTAKGESCAACARLEGKVLTVAEALRTMPIPCPGCRTWIDERPSNERGWCRCTYAGAA